MKVLLDTHTFLWGLNEAEKLSTTARQTIASSETFLSVVSLWEILIKVQAGRLPLPLPASDYLVSKASENGVSILPVKLEHILH